MVAQPHVIIHPRYTGQKEMHCDPCMEKIINYKERITENSKDGTVAWVKEKTNSCVNHQE